VKRKSRLSVALLIVAALALGTAAAGSSRSLPFPCHSSWSLNEGIPAGLVVAGLGVNCASLSRAASLTVTGRLQKLDARTGKWHVLRTQTASWADLSRTRSIDLREPCAHAVFRALFSAVLRYSSGAVGGRTSIDSGRLQVVVPCV
jgi:hypothetical protein